MDIELEQPETWPDALRELVNRNRGQLVSYQLARERIDELLREDVGARIWPPKNQWREVYEALIKEAEALLLGHRLVGYHCTRLTAPEVVGIRANGLRALTPHLVAERINALKDAGEMQPERCAFFLDGPVLADYLANRRGTRAGSVWLCPNRSVLRDAPAVFGLLSYWGGEALYKGFEHEAGTAAELRSIGKPAIVRYAVPFDSVLASNVAPRLLSHAVTATIAHPEPSVSFDWNVRRDLAASEVTDIILFEDAGFDALTDQHSWVPPYRLP
ncbi:hypothetical protein [Stenotrophomonas sp. PS02298]|uniref:hypothetical protein n=1 Tax=Stenotrophomonas sp. PS02298 TaxID=2991424 RepID=UPI00249BDB95|nr:hypothetical protein [Stenotrophomonas sp. PS02298]